VAEETWQAYQAEEEERIQQEPEANSIKVSRKYRHLSLLHTSTLCNKEGAPRIWLLRAEADRFAATEQTAAHFLPGGANAFPAWQRLLYDPQLQPALFLVTLGRRVWLWQGWWPHDANNNTDADAAAATGSAELRFKFARKAALETAAALAQAKGKDTPQLVAAGLEPLAFTQLFPTWQYRDDIADLQRKSGRFSAVAQHAIPPLLAALHRPHYPRAELRPPLPDGVDPLRLEDYLCQEEFAEVLGMAREEFAALQPWKQLQLKRAAGLF